MDKSKEESGQIGARERWSRTSRIRAAILACKVNWGTVMRIKS